MLSLLLLVAQVSASPPTGTFEFFLGYGVLGVVFVLTMLGYLRPKWHSDEQAKALAFKDGIIERQTIALERIADKLEAKP